MRTRTPSGPTGRDSTSRSPFGASVSPNRRRPAPRTVGKTISRSSSTRSRSTSAATSWPLPLTRMSPPSASRSAAMSSSETTFELFHSGSRNVEETTYFCIPLNLSANSPSRVGHAAAKPSHVTRPSRSASEAITSSSLNLSPSSPRSNWKAQAPRSIPSEPPGSSKTPSIVTNCDTTTGATSASFASSLQGRTRGAGETHRELDGDRLFDGRGRVEQPFEQLPVAFDLDALPAALDEQVVERGGRCLHEDVGV